MEQKTTGKTDFERLRAMTDEEIDCSDIPELTEEDFKSDEWFATRPDQELFMFSVDRSVLAFFRRQGRGYRERMNDVLRDYALANA